MNKQEIQTIIDTIQYLDWKFHIGQDQDRLYLQIRVDNGKDNVTGHSIHWSGRKWMLSEFMCKNEIVATAFKAVQTAAEHELRENFKYRGLTIFDPHMDPDKLWELRNSPDCLNERDNSNFGV